MNDVLECFDDTLIDLGDIFISSFSVKEIFGDDCFPTFRFPTIPFTQKLKFQNSSPCLPHRAPKYIVP